MQLLILGLPPFLLVSLHLSPALAPDPGADPGVELPESDRELEPLRATTLTPGEVSSGPTNTMAQTTIATQDQKSVHSNPVITVPQSSVETVPPTPTSMDHKTSSSSSSNRKPILTLPSDSTLTDHPAAQNLPATTPIIITVPTAVQTVYLEVIISSAAGLGDAILPGVGNVPPEASATSGGMANAAVVQIFPTTSLIVSTVSSVPAATTSTRKPIAPLSAGMSIVSPVTSATLGKPADSAIHVSGYAGGGGNGSSLVTGSGSTTRSGSATGSGNPTGRGSTTGSSIATGSSVATGSVNSSESVLAHTSVPVVPTGGAEGATRWESWWLEPGVLVWGVGMVFWL